MKQTLAIGAKAAPAVLLAGLGAAGLEHPGVNLSAGEAAGRLMAGGIWLVLADSRSLADPVVADALELAGRPPVVLLDGASAGPGAAARGLPTFALPESATGAEVRALLSRLPEAWRDQQLALLSIAATDLARPGAGPLTPRVKGLAGRLAQALSAARLGIYACESAPGGPIYPLLASAGDNSGMPAEVRAGTEEAGQILASRRPGPCGRDLLVPIVSGERIHGLVWMDAGDAGGEPDAHRMRAWASAGVLAMALDARAAREGGSTGGGLEPDHLAWKEKLSSLGQLAAGIAHEINNPLFVITGNLELASSLVPQKARTLLDKALKAAERIRRIVFDMRQFYLPVSHAARVAPVDINTLVASSVQIVSLQPAFRTVSFVKDLGDGLTPVVGDDNQLLQVLTQLLLNAAQAMPKGGIITVRTREQDGRVVLTVADTGVGIPRENLARVFDPFFTTKQDWMGTGLGLSVSYTIVKNHGGAIELDSEEGRGSTFTVRLPVAPRPEPARSVEPGGPARGAAASRRVLVADDEDTVRDFLEFLLTDAGYQVDLARDGATALEMLGRADYGVVLMDHLMPGLSGIEICREIRARRPGLPVILVTGAVSVNPEELVRDGFFRVLAKPCRADELLAAVSAALSAPAEPTAEPPQAGG
jgi:signal transduction histidine kinase/ActR/RegA family two-component response regulator